MNNRVMIAIVAFAVALASGLAFMRVLGRIMLDVSHGTFAQHPPKSAGWHLLHTRTRDLLREYHHVCPDGTLDRYLYVFYLIGGAAAIVFFVDLLSFLAGRFRR